MIGSREFGSALAASFIRIADGPFEGAFFVTTTFVAELSTYKNVRECLHARISRARLTPTAVYTLASILFANTMFNVRVVRD